MSLEIIAKLICDNCKAEIAGKTCNRSTRSAESYWDAMRASQAQGWIVVSRGRYRKPAHVCKGCADKPMPKLPEPPRIPKCKGCKGHGVVYRTKDGEGVLGSGFLLKGLKCPTCNGTGKRTNTATKG